MISCKSDKDKEVQNENERVSSSEKTAEESFVDESIERGKEIYADFCVACHLPSGQGISGTYPPLDGSNWLTEKREQSISAIKHGLTGPIEVNGKKYDNVMTPMGLSDHEIADVMNYIMNSWSNDIDPPVTKEEVAAIKEPE